MRFANVKLNNIAGATITLIFSLLEMNGVIELEKSGLPPLISTLIFFSIPFLGIWFGFRSARYDNLKILGFLLSFIHLMIIWIPLVFFVASIFTLF